MRQIDKDQLTPDEKELLAAAIAVRRHAYAPYSNYQVGAAVRGTDGRIYAACNIESADYTLTTHAEVQALNQLQQAGAGPAVTVLVVVQSDVGWGFPCGLCRQKIREFAAPDIPIYGVNLDRAGRVAKVSLSNLEELLPYSFGPDFLR